MRQAFFVFIILFLAVIPAQTKDEPLFPPALDSVAWAYIDTAMYFSGTTPRDAEFEKKWATDTLFRLSIVNRFLDYPLELPDSLDSWTTFMMKNYDNLSELVVWMFKRIDVDFKKDIMKIIDKDLSKISNADSTASSLPEPYRSSLRTLLAAFDIADRHRENMMEDLSSESLDSLLYLLPTFWTDEEDTLADSLECYFLKLLGHECDTALEIHLDSLYETIHSIDIDELGFASVAISVGTQKAIQILKENKNLPYLDNIQKFETRWGEVQIGTKNSDVYSNASIIIDPGGDDIYKGDFGSGVLGRNYFGVVIDLEGNDIYDSRRTIFSQATGVFGCGIIADLSGDDVYLTSHYGQGAGLFGTGLLVDFEGDDRYSCGVYVQGAGNFGIGAIVDMSGEDIYNSYAYSQAFAGPKGFGLSLDNDGSDNYYCGGKYSHAPLAPLDYHSFAQGFSIGWRPDVSGGVGLMFDNKGNDSYTAGVYSQATGYWYTLGLLIDNEGNDIYNSVYYPQGSGIHLAIGALVDRDGDDVYVSRSGPGQGSAHDYSVGFLSDYRGDDIYVIDGGNAAALTNSFALFVDRNGDDLYAKKRTRSSNYGIARSARGTGSFALFLDLEGPDQYPLSDKADNNSWWFYGDVGVGLDVVGEPFPEPVKELAEEIAEEELDTPRTMEKIFKEASVWAVGSAQIKAKKAFEELVDSGQAAADYICEKQLATKSSLRLRTIKNFTKEVPELMRPCLFKALHDENLRRRGNAIYVFGEAKDTMAVDSLIPLLKKKKARLGVISALGKIKDTSAVMPIMKWKDEERQSVRYMVSKALSDIGDPRSIPILLDFLNDDYLTVRIAAQYGIQNMWENSFDTVLFLLNGKDKNYIINLLRITESICKKIVDDTTLTDSARESQLALVRKTLLLLLEHDNEVIRGHTVRTLISIGGDETLADLRRRYELEPEPFVRKMYEQALKTKGKK
jgi:HEAT repeat protein